jgi:16S rRNA (cytosine1402-N4)-methyltransferase
MANNDLHFEIRHKPVLAQEVLIALNLQSGQNVVDCTLGLGGHSRLMLEKIGPTGRLIGFDFDQANIERARSHLGGAGNFSLHHSNFAAISTVLLSEGAGQVDAILADLGVASPQIDDANRGFSYRKPGPLDMRMDLTRSESAARLIARISEADLRDAILELGDETDAPEIARLIVERRAEQPITDTIQLANIISEARDFTPQRAAGAKLHPAARTFQALRMLVNREAHNLERLLKVAPEILKPGGRIAIISFHSGEDRRVKHSFKENHRAGSYREISDEPIVADEAEQKFNPRSRSAKLRWAEKSAPPLER